MKLCPQDVHKYDSSGTANNVLQLNRASRAADRSESDRPSEPLVGYSDLSDHTPRTKELGLGLELTLDPNEYDSNALCRVIQICSDLLLIALIVRIVSDEE